MALDFRGNQIRTNKIIASGSTLYFYPSAGASDLSGTIAFTTTNIGTDVFAVFSGAVGGRSTTNGRGITLFMGDVVASGSISARTGFSGSLTKLYDGTSYLLGAGSVTVVTNSNGSITISGSGGGSGGTSFSTPSGSIVYSGSAGPKGIAGFIFDDNVGNRTVTISGEDPKIILSASIFPGQFLKTVYGNTYLTVPSAPADETIYDYLVTMASSGVSGSGGNFKIYGGSAGYNGSFGVPGGGVQMFGGTGGNSNTPTAGDGGSFSFTGGTGGNNTAGNAGGNGGSVTLTAGDAGAGASAQAAGGNINLSAGSANFTNPGLAGSVEINAGFTYGGLPGTIFFDRVLSAGSITMGSVLSVPSDAYFYMSGTVGKKAVFENTLLLSGGLSGSLTKLANGSSYLVAGPNISIVTQSNGSIFISASSGGGGGTSIAADSGSIIYSGSVAKGDRTKFAFDDNKGTLRVSGSATQFLVGTLQSGSFTNVTSSIIVPFSSGGLRAESNTGTAGESFNLIRANSNNGSQNNIAIGQNDSVVVAYVGLTASNGVRQQVGSFFTEVNNNAGMAVGATVAGGAFTGVGLGLHTLGQVYWHDGSGTYESFMEKPASNNFRIGAAVGSYHISYFGPTTPTIAYRSHAFFAGSTRPLAAFCPEVDPAGASFYAPNGAGIYSPALYFGDPSNPITRAVIGIVPRGGASSNTAGADLVIESGIGRGTGAFSNIDFRGPVVTGSGGSILQPTSSYAMFNGASASFYVPVLVASQSTLKLVGELSQSGTTRIVSFDTVTSSFTLTRTTNTRVRMLFTGSKGVILGFNPTAADIGLQWELHDASRTAHSSSMTISTVSGALMNSVVSGSYILTDRGGVVVVRVEQTGSWETVGR